MPWFIDKRESVLGVAIACIGFGGAAGTWLFGVLLLAIGMMVVAIIMGLLAMQLAPMRKLHVLTCHHHGGTIGM